MDQNLINPQIRATRVVRKHLLGKLIGHEILQMFPLSFEADRYFNVNRSIRVSAEANYVVSSDT